MGQKWTQERLQKLIDEETQESLTLEYKGADALEKTPGRKTEITKDVSAMANSDGGILIYGISQCNERDRRHLPETVEAIDRSQYSQEWLEQVINNIRPRIKGLVIHPVTLDTALHHVAYVVEIPKSNTAHQATDHRYYLRYNFSTVPMEDYQIRDVMHRGTKPDVSVKFESKRIPSGADSQKHKYLLRIFVENHGATVVNHYKVMFSIPEEIPVQYDINAVNRVAYITVEPRLDKGGFRVSCRSMEVLFPDEVLEIGIEMKMQFEVTNEIYHKIKIQNPTLNWKLFADDMPPKLDRIPFNNLHNF